MFESIFVKIKNKVNNHQPLKKIVKSDSIDNKIASKNFLDLTNDFSKNLESLSISSSIDVSIEFNSIQNIFFELKNPNVESFYELFKVNFENSHISIIQNEKKIDLNNKVELIISIPDTFKNLYLSGSSRVRVENAMLSSIKTSGSIELNINNLYTTTSLNRDTLQIQSSGASSIFLNLIRSLNLDKESEVYFSLSGSSDIVVNNSDFSRLKVETAGSSTIKFSGTHKFQNSNIQTSGASCFEGLKTLFKNLEVSSSGASSIKFKSTGLIVAKCSGSSFVRGHSIEQNVKLSGASSYSNK